LPLLTGRSARNREREPGEAEEMYAAMLYMFLARKTKIILLTLLMYAALC
jgi:hypothetical protein